MCVSLSEPTIRLLDLLEKKKMSSSNGDGLFTSHSSPSTLRLLSLVQDETLGRSVLEGSIVLERLDQSGPIVLERLDQSGSIVLERLDQSGLMVLNMLGQ